MKSVLRNLAADMCRITGATSLARRAGRSSLVILCYHRILPVAKRNAYTLPTLAVTPEAFDAQVAVAARHYRCLPLREAMAALEKGTPSQPLLTVSLDDGYADNAVHAAPVLEKHGVRATFFVVSGLIDSTERTWYDLLGRLVQHAATQLIPELSRKPDETNPVAVWIAEHFRHRHGLNISRILAAAKALPHTTRREVMNRLYAVAPPDLLQNDDDRLMTRGQLNLLASRGHEIASHTVTHPLLPRLTDDELHAELIDSKTAIAQMTGAEVVSLAYPNGDHDDRIVAAARAAGYRFAVTTRPGRNRRTADPLRLSRLYVSQERTSRGNGACSSGLFELELAGLADHVFLRRRRQESTP